MKTCLNVNLHLPKRLAHYTMFDVGEHSNYFNNEHSKHEFENSINVFENFLKGFNQKINLSISGIMLELIQNYKPELIEIISEKVKKGKAELVCETYHHSHAFIYSKKEFKEQVNLHKEKLVEMFNYTPTTFKNTDFLYSDEVAKAVHELGFKTILAGVENVDSHKVYKEEETRITILVNKNNVFSESKEVNNVFVDYRDLNKDYEDKEYVKASELKGEHPLKVDNHEVKWHKLHSDLYQKVYEIEHKVKEKACNELLNTWRYLTSSNVSEDHDNYEGYIKFRNILKDLTLKI